MLKQLSKSEWDRYKAAHLLSRAGFGGTPDAIEALAAKGLKGAVSQLVNFHKLPYEGPELDWLGPGADARPNFRMFRKLPEEERREKQREARKRENERVAALRGWWLQRMLETPRPLEEKLTLFWHGHFATSVQKVKSSYALYRQNRTFRTHAAGNWRTLALEAAREPAMLLYLDNVQSRKKSPNENLARELMELFTLGEGHYTEKDIKEAARALTGWSLDGERFAYQFRPFMHDTGQKTFMGETGPLKGDDIVRLILEQPQAARFIGSKLWRFFVEQDISEELADTLGDALRGHDYELRPFLRDVFSSELFYRKEVMRTQVKSPVQWLVGSLKICEHSLPPPRLASGALRQLGQELFAPPNVKGWDGGYAWITTSTLMNRYNMAGTLLHGQGGGNRMRDKVKNRMMQRVLKPAADDVLLPATARKNKESALSALVWRIYQGQIREADLATLREHIAALPEPSDWQPRDVRELVHYMMCAPQYQLT